MNTPNDEMAKIAGDHKTSPENFAENTMQFYDEELESAITKVHEMAARKGMPIVTFVVPEPREMATVVTVKNMMNVPAPILVAILIAGGEHPRVAEMLAGAVYASQDQGIRRKYLEMLAEAVQIPEPWNLTDEVLATKLSKNWGQPPVRNQTIQDDLPNLSDQN